MAITAFTEMNLMDLNLKVPVDFVATTQAEVVAAAISSPMTYANKKVIALDTNSLLYFNENGTFDDTGFKLFTNAQTSNASPVITGDKIIDSVKAATVPILTLKNNVGDSATFLLNGNPESVITGSIGDKAVDVQSGILYSKKTGNNTNTGWHFLVDKQSGDTAYWKAAGTLTGATAQTIYIQTADPGAVANGSLWIRI